MEVINGAIVRMEVTNKTIAKMEATIAGGTKRSSFQFWPKVCLSSGRSLSRDRKHEMRPVTYNPLPRRSSQLRATNYLVCGGWTGDPNASSSKCRDLSRLAVLPTPTTSDCRLSSREVGPRLATGVDSSSSILGIHSTKYKLNLISEIGIGS